MAMAEVKVPPSTKEKKQLEKVDIDWGRELSLVRIHVEYIIGLLKQKFTILEGTIPVTLLKDHHSDQSIPTIDKIVRVCCSLVNLCPPVVSQD